MASVTSSPVITSILAVPGLSTTGVDAAGENGPALVSTHSIYVGVVLDSKHIAWGTCPAPAPSGNPAGLPLKESLAVIRDVVAPAFEGNSMAGYSEMAVRLAALEARSTFTRSLPEANTESQMSRRDLLMGQLGKRDAGPRIETVTVEGPISPSIRLGISEALLKALARAQGSTIAELLAQEYGLSPPRAIIPIHAEARGGQALPLYPQLASLEFKVPGVEPEREMGENGEQLQRLTRQLSERIAAAAGGKRPFLHLNVNGGLGRLYQNDIGKILGALYGLQRAAAPVALRVEDPVFGDDLKTTSGLMAELGDLLRMRSMSVQLVAGASINASGDVWTTLEQSSAQMIRLSMVRLGTIHETMAAALACRDKGVAVLLSGAPAELLAQVALALGPALVAAPDGPAGLEELYGAMARNSAWLLSKRRIDSDG